MALLDNILNNLLSGAGQAKGTLDDLILAGNQPGFNTPGSFLRFLRGGPGDAILNIDQPDPQLVQQQIGPIRQEALRGQFFPQGQFDESQLLNFMLAGQRGFGVGRATQPATFSQFLKDPNTGKFLGSKSVVR